MFLCTLRSIYKTILKLEKISIEIKSLWKDKIFKSFNFNWDNIDKKEMIKPNDTFAKKDIKINNRKCRDLYISIFSKIINILFKTVNT